MDSLILVLLLMVFGNPVLGYSLGTIKKPINKIFSTYSDEICETEQCVEAAASILKNMDKSVDPCDDFYSFACGNYKTMEISAHKSRENSFSILSDKIKKLLKIEFEKEPSENDIKPFKLTRKFYQICLNGTNANVTGEQEFLELIEKFGGWPVLKGDSWDEKFFDWKNITPAFLEEGYWLNIFVNVALNVDSKNVTKSIITLDQADLGIPYSYLSMGLNEPIVKAYYNYMVDLTVALGADPKIAKKEMFESLNFEIEIAKILIPVEKRRNHEDLYNLMSTREMTENYPGIDWVDYINNILKPHSSLNDSDLINVAVLSYLNDLDVLLKSTPKRVMANYAMWRVTKDSVPMLSERLNDLAAEFSKVFTGSSVKASRWEDCIDCASKTFNHAVSAIYVRNHFSMAAKNAAEELILNLKDSFENMLNKVDWMDDLTKKAALEKLKNIVPHIAFPVELLDDEKLEEYYRNLDLDSDSFFKTYLKIHKFHHDKTLREFRESINVTDWRKHVTSAVVNAFYNAKENSMQFPAGILQGVFFGNDRPKYTNYGGIGYAMGHEITHGFDDQGSQFDKFGNLREWWEKETKAKYLRRTKCIINQYSKNIEEGLNLNGINTQGENIADNGGIKASYFAYNDWEERNGIEPRLPGLYYNSQQMFWISAANSWCEAVRPEALRNQIITDSHSPSKFRVNGPMSNIPEFSKDFNCPLGSKMNPFRKCTVW